ncbi:hypothetical protein IGI04_019447 [Brassica rapa subsp. trilocularis]|uniref:Uncharacterized protein n=1 Tax=Brassica rapa subsp. trilocularis TaxID=1813537 RepID=A0ABQ7MHF6_BRACM|nr:hypothetical protein IGI04_019447 [Brassica rapa subsp. trilocularis]
MPRSDRRIVMAPALVGRVSLSRFREGMEWIDGRHKEQWIGSLICHAAALNESGTSNGSLVSSSFKSANSWINSMGRRVERTDGRMTDPRFSLVSDGWYGPARLLPVIEPATDWNL